MRRVTPFSVSPCRSDASLTITMPSATARPVSQCAVIVKLFERMSHRVPEIQQLALTRLGFVVLDHQPLDIDAAGDGVLEIFRQHRAAVRKLTKQFGRP